jgi:hypothetical protein
MTLDTHTSESFLLRGLVRDPISGLQDAAVARQILVVKELELDLLEDVCKWSSTIHIIHDFSVYIDVKAGAINAFA